ncbi:Rv0909 family putative TA system antitoxin [Dermabacter vaginalis]|uniref:Antitoxin n=1 Tax=Dermabacter vaginalis TaxID=1630135 RepID=A0A1B0ZGC9_9MICO|nr:MULTISPECIES: Rv0909 family putative TA system antitoxin [Dermabacter]ANP27008.1 hypothetical protein DAD186_04530 [Dermabacter vaginalis]MCG7444222.1 antitoxin [Dermabacter vaginalis]MCT2150382.1 Rv0909 family putative TA system antitoxin [Dermabacter vaginalis]QEU12458.1 antitoxin [Dermabacter vaginalis]RUP86287.1 antitoxin [Dermabacter sp. HSID17554]
MGFDDALNKAKGAFEQNEDKVKDFAKEHDAQVDGAIDKASEKAQDVAPDQLGDKIAGGAEKGKDAFDKFHG